MFAAYLPYRDKGLLPESGGVLDQSPAIMDSIAALDWMVAMWMQNLERDDPENLPGIDELG